ncbi:MAG: DUF354 domain-containing protein [Bacteroidales bacterium]|nr:DUF354 domain-containing protein [Bacteroidales bacterium]
MNILFDLVHPADVNLFKHVIQILNGQGHRIVITLRQRGSPERIAQQELAGFNLCVIGSHQKSILRKVLAFISREIKFFGFLKKEKIDVAVCQGVTFGFSCKLRGIPLIHHDDDHEYRFSFLLGKYLSAKDIMPDFMPVKGSNFIKYRGYKELAYLHPNYFKPDQKIVSANNLTPFRYVFIREIANISLNYQGRTSFLVEILKHLKKKGLEILLSLEDKSKTPDFQPYATILKDPLTTSIP